MFKYRPGIDAPPEWVSIERSALFGWVGTGVAAAVTGAFVSGAVPHLLVTWATLPVAGACGILSAVGAMKMRSIRARMEHDFMALGATRQFTFTGSHLPIKYERHKRHVNPFKKPEKEERVWFPFPWVKDGPGEHDPSRVSPPEPIHSKRWTMRWVPYTVEQFSFVGHGGKTFGYFRKHLVLPRGQVFRDRKAWLMKHHPALWECVRTWWIEHWIVPELKALLGDTWADLVTPDQQRDVAARHECELLMGVAIASDTKLWKQRVGYGYEFHYFPVLQGRLLSVEEPAGSDIPDPPVLPTFPMATHVFMGKGFKWETRHAQAYELMKPRDVSEVTDKPLDQGNPLVYGTGLHDETMIFCDIANINQHVGIFGSTGVGKTRYVEPLIVQMIRSGFPIIIIDPKGDADLTNRTYQEARACGRGHQVRYYSLVLPKNPNVCTYNPLNHYNDPTFLGTRVGAVIANTKDPFWKEEAIKTSREILTMCHWMREFLRFIDRDPVTKALPPRHSARVPKLLLMMQLARKDPSMDPAIASAEVDELIRQVDAGKYPEDKHLESVVRLMQDKRYAPVEWNPTVRQVTAWGIDNTVQFLGWAIKIFQFHAFLGSDAQAQVNYPEVIPDGEILGKGQVQGKPYASIWATHKQAMNHPLALLANPDLMINQNYKVWVQYYKDVIGTTTPEDDIRINEIVDRYRSQLDSVATMAQLDRDKFLEKISTLSAAMSRFRGARERIVCAQDPDLTWDRTVDEDLIVYCGLGQLVDADGANGVAKMMIQDVASFIGEVYNFRDGKEKPFVLVCDEIASFINEPMIDLLNKGRGAGLHCIIIGQSIPDLEACLQDKAKAQQVMANLNTKIQLRAGLPVDAEEFSKSASKVSVEIIARSGFGITPGVGKSGHQAIQGFSANESFKCEVKDVPKIPPEAITGMPRGQAYIAMMGETYYVAMGMFPKPSCNMKSEFQMTASGPDALGYIPLFEDPPKGSGGSGRAIMSYASLYDLPHQTGSQASALPDAGTDMGQSGPSSRGSATDGVHTDPKVKTDGVGSEPGSEATGSGAKGIHQTPSEWHGRKTAAVHEMPRSDTLDKRMGDDDGFTM